MGGDRTFRPDGQPPFGPEDPSGWPPPYGPAPGSDDVAGHTRQYTYGGAPAPQPTWDDYPEPPPSAGAAPAPPPPGYDPPRVATYRAGEAVGPPAAPRPPWRDLLLGVVRHPADTFARCRAQQLWAPALIVSFVYGILALLGIGQARSELFGSTAAITVTELVAGGLGFVLGGFVLGAVTHGVARQIGGDGAWAPTIGLSLLVAWLTDVPRLLFALFLPATSSIVRVLGLGTWAWCAVLLTLMVRRTHDLPWYRALGAATIQLVALLFLLKLPTLS